MNELDHNTTTAELEEGDKKTTLLDSLKERRDRLAAKLDVANRAIDLLESGIVSDEDFQTLVQAYRS